MEVNPTDRPDDEGGETQEPVAAEQVDATPKAEEEDEEYDYAPLTVDEFKDTAQQVVSTVRDGLLIPLYRGGRRLMRGAEGAANEFFSGATGDKKKKRD